MVGLSITKLVSLWESHSNASAQEKFNLNQVTESSGYWALFSFFQCSRFPMLEQSYIGWNTQTCPIWQKQQPGIFYQSEDDAIGPTARFVDISHDQRLPLSAVIRLTCRWRSGGFCPSCETTFDEDDLVLVYRS